MMHAMAGLEITSEMSFRPSRTHAGKPLFAPVLATLIQKRGHALVLIGAAALLFSSSLLGIQIWFCPFKTTLGISCPGCGLTTATSLLVLGEWRAAIGVHAFAPVFLLGFILIGASVVMPERYRRKFLQITAGWEGRFGFIPVVLAGLMVYWIVRSVSG